MHTLRESRCRQHGRQRVAGRNAFAKLRGNRKRSCGRVVAKAHLSREDEEQLAGDGSASVEVRPGGRVVVDARGADAEEYTGFGE